MSGRIGGVSIEYLEGLVARSNERRKGFLFGSHKTSKAEAAEIVLLAMAPAMIQEIKRLREKCNGIKGARE